jgi:hypothetical protein
MKIGQVRSVSERSGGFVPDLALDENHFVLASNLKLSLYLLSLELSLLETLNSELVCRKYAIIAGSRRDYT